MNLSERTDKNPLIQDNPADTLYYVQSVLIALEEFYSGVDLPERSPDAMVNTGIFWILKCSDQALSYEIGRVKKK